jgi:L-alanine-DL-glutamate epimerase-like enolase superfamily enzyme
MVPSALSAVDIALWDWAGKQVGLPIYQMLGGARSRILSYASTPLLPSIKAYIDLIAELRAQGFRAVKLHTWCVLERDLALVQAVRGAYPDLTLMLDVENNYDRMAALRMARVLAELNFHWFEAPLPDFDLEGYCAIRAQAAVPLLPAGNWILDPHGIRRGLSMGAWDAARTDTAVCGGISAAKDVFAIAHSFGTTCELQAWGHTLSQAANLQVALGLSACTFFEQPVPYAPFEYGMGTVIRTEPDGYVSAPPGPGLGVEIDWPAMKAATVYRFSSRDPLL